MSNEPTANTPSRGVLSLQPVARLEHLERCEQVIKSLEVLVNRTTCLSSVELGPEGGAGCMRVFVGDDNAIIGNPYADNDEEADGVPAFTFEQFVHELSDYLRAVAEAK